MKGKIKVSIVIIEVLIALGILAVPLIRFGRLARFIDFSTPAWAASTGKAMMTFYNDTYPNSPCYRVWDGSSWGGESSANTVEAGVSRWHILRSNPKKDEKILGTIDEDADTNVQVWNGTSWSAATQLTGDSTVAYRSFDIAYEQNSGEAIVVYRKSTDISVPKCHKWDGSSWTLIGDLTDRTDSIGWVRLKPKPGSNEIMLVTLDSGNDLNAQIWDGDNDTWGTYYTIWLDAAVNTQPCFDIAYEQLSKDCMIAYARAGDLYSPYYSIWDGSAWTGDKATDHAEGVAIRWVRLAAKPGSDEIMMATMDDGNDITAEIWDGSVWGTKLLNLEKSTPYDTRRCYDVAYESSSGDGMIVWSDTTTTAYSPKYRTWVGGIWGSETGATKTADDAGIVWVRLVPNPDTDEIMLMTSDTNDDLNIQKWNGSVWGSILEVEDNAPITQEPFAIDYDRHSPQVSIIIQKWRELYH